MTGPDPPADRLPRLGPVSSVIVVRRSVPSADALAAWGRELACLFDDVELVIVANGASSTVALELEVLAAKVPDVTVHFLAARIDHDSARLVGMDVALNDWVLLAPPRPELVPVLHELAVQACKGYQVLCAVGAPRAGSGLLYTRLQRSYFWTYRLLTGRTLLHPSPVLGLYARPAALFVAGSAEGEMLLRADSIAGGFPAFIGRYPQLAAEEPARQSWRDVCSRAVQGLLSASTLPLRLASMIAVASGGLSLLYSLYVVGIYLLKPDVLPGWTTLSLQISGMMFLFSLMFALMAEYVLGIYRGLAPRRRYVVTRELRSPMRRHAARLNVVDESGAFHLGMPEEIAP